MSIYCNDDRSRRALCFTPMETDRRIIVEAAVRAERLGFEAVIVPEGRALDSGVVLTEIALRTDRIRLVAGTQSIWGRTAAQLAMEAATLADVSGGRFTLGLGASTPELANGLHRRPYERPTACVGDTLTEVRRLLAGERANTPIGHAVRLGLRPASEIPIWVAGIGPRMFELALSRADAWFPTFVPRDNVANLRRNAGIEGQRCELVTGPVAAVSDDPTVARDAIRQSVGWYLTGLGRQYGDRLAQVGFAREVAMLRLLNGRPRPGRVTWPDAADVLLDELGVHGEEGAVARELERWDAVADVVSVTVPPGLGGGVHDLVEAAAPSMSPASTLSDR